MANIGIVGAGSWGTALSVVLKKNGHAVTLWSILESEIQMLKEHHEHTEKLLLQNLRSMTDKTVVIVTHRPAALEICDRVIDFGNG